MQSSHVEGVGEGWLKWEEEVESQTKRQRVTDCILGQGAGQTIYTQQAGIYFQGNYLPTPKKVIRLIIVRDVNIY